MNALDRHKRELIARSEVYREIINEEIHDIKVATAWVPQTLRVLRVSLPVLILAAPLVSRAFGRRKKTSAAPALAPAVAPKPSGLVAKAMVGWRLFRKVKPIWDGFQQIRS